MTFPSGPYPQGYPEQPGFSQPPGFQAQPPIYQPGFGQQPGYAQPGWPQQPGYPGGYQPKPPGGPSGATGIFAGILALLGGLIGIVFLVVDVLVMWFDREFDTIGAVFALFSLAFGLAQFIGAILLWRRKMIGRRLVVAGCAVAILLGVVVLGDTTIGISGDPTREPLAISIVVAVGLVLPIVTLVLAMLPSTTKWIRAKQNAVAPQYYPPYPG